MTLTPMMQQFHNAKEQVPDCLLLFRMGDFYELFDADAEEAGRILGLTVTSRDKGDNPMPMAGFPYHSLDNYLAKLLEAGRRVAICEQVEDPKQAKGLVKREITRIVTPGTLTDDELLDPKQNNYLAAVVNAPRKPNLLGLAWIDLSAGRLTVASIATDSLDDELARLEPAELLVADDASADTSWLVMPTAPTKTVRPGWTFAKQNAHDLLKRHFQVHTFEGFGVADNSPGLLAAGALLSYLLETQKTDLRHIARLESYARGDVMMIDPVTRRSLELTRTLRENRRDGTLLDTIDSTVTSAGARCLADWINEPLLDINAIKYRQAAVGEWKDDPAGRDAIRDLLKKTYDVERLSSRVATGRTNPRDLAALRETLRWLPGIKAKLTARQAQMNADLEERLQLLPEMRDRLEAMLVDEPPFLVRDGGIIREGYHADLDELRQIATGGKQWMANFQRSESERTSIPNLKIGFNKVFGYYIEIPNSGKDKVPADYDRKQTLKNAERYITPQLKEFEQKVLTAEEKSKALEYDLFVELRQLVAAEINTLQELSRGLAELDCVIGLAETAATCRYVRPDVVEDTRLIIHAGRHPVLDATLEAGRFVPNDCLLADDSGSFLLITGPNMAGKSTYIRQVALITLMAQIGSFVPADAATIGVADRIFTRVGASDELGRGQSTFMVEMTETANILNNATIRSLVILDEIGRGTSTYDGVSLAWAITEHLHDKVSCRTLFATHYHELIQLSETLDNLRNRNIAVREWQDEIIFLHQIVDGGADRSYGIHVARLAGVPTAVLKRAQKILEQLERDPFGEQAVQQLQRPKKHRRTYHQMSLFPTSTGHPVLDEIRVLDADGLSPEQALEEIRRWKEGLRRDDG